MTTKIHLLADALGRPLRFLLTDGEVYDSRTAERMMLDGVRSGAVIADKAYDSNALRAAVKVARMKAVIPSNRSRKTIIRHDKQLYRIEQCFNKLKHFRRHPLRPPCLPLLRLSLPRRSHAMDVLNVDSA